MHHGSKEKGNNTVSVVGEIFMAAISHAAEVVVKGGRRQDHPRKPSIDRTQQKTLVRVSRLVKFDWLNAFNESFRLVKSDELNFPNLI